MEGLLAAPFRGPPAGGSREFQPLASPCKCTHSLEPLGHADRIPTSCSSQFMAGEHRVTLPALAKMVVVRRLGSF